MHLVDGLNHFKSLSSYQFTVRLERDAQNILRLLQLHGDAPPASALTAVKSFLVEVEKWKALCLESRMGNAETNAERVIWNALLDATRAATDKEQILTIMTLKGFGRSVDGETRLRRAKVATSVVRFLWPEKWGVVDWRVAVMLGLLSKHGENFDAVLAEAKNLRAQDLREYYDLINEQVACELNAQYRVISQRHPEMLCRAANVDMALFGLSLHVWPMKF
ncbi:hypothetical protein [Paraburkholderia hospita]|uniref:hypothetical protein n=1 Tax=Paraburkholderia hospita TaxID=169430 RepID=UPI003ECFC549